MQVSIYFFNAQNGTTHPSDGATGGWQNNPHQENRRHADQGKSGDKADIKLVQDFKINQGQRAFFSLTSYPYKAEYKAYRVNQIFFIITKKRQSFYIFGFFCKDRIFIFMHMHSTLDIRTKFKTCQRRQKECT